MIASTTHISGISQTYTFICIVYFFRWRFFFYISCVSNKPAFALKLYKICLTCIVCIVTETAQTLGVNGIFLINFGFKQFIC